MVEIRKGTEQDIEQAVELGKAYYKESAFGSMEFDESKARELCSSLLKSGLGIVADDNGQIVGMMGAILITHVFTDTLMAQDVLVYIKPEYRGKGISSRLIAVYVNWAENHGVKKENIFLGINSGVDRAKTERIYNKLGFKRFGVTMRLQEV